MSELDPLATGKPSLGLTFSGKGRDVRLDRVIFRNHQATRTSKWRDHFVWTTAVQAMALLFVKHARSRTCGESLQGELSGHGGSPASSLDYAISKGTGLTWLTEMFGTFEAEARTRTVATTMFARQNSNRTDKSRPVRITVNSNFLKPSQIEIVWNSRQPVSDEELAELEDALSAALFQSSALELPDLPPEKGEQPQTFHDIYREIWTAPIILEQKIERSRQLLGTASPRPYIDLLYSIRATVDAGHNAELDFEIAVCNCGERPLERKRHNFWFAYPQATPFPPIKCSGTETATVHTDDPTRKTVFINFGEPIPPGGVHLYRFGFAASAMFRNPRYWEFEADTITNDFILYVTQEGPRRVRETKVVRASEVSPEVIDPLAFIIEWGRGITMNWHLPFPETGSMYRFKWEVDGAEE